jgi:hypothetical protein
MPPSDRYREFLETTHYGSPEALNLETAMAPIAHRFITTAELAAAAKRAGPGHLFTIAEARAAAKRYKPDMAKSGEAMCKQIGDRLGVDWNEVDLDEFCDGMFVEEEHKDVTGGDPVLTAKIVLAHLRERKDYYSRLDKYVEKALSGAYLLKSHVKGHTRRSKSGAVSTVTEHERHMAYRGEASPERIAETQAYIQRLRDEGHGILNAKLRVWDPQRREFRSVKAGEKQSNQAHAIFAKVNEVRDHWFAATNPEKMNKEDWPIVEQHDLPRPKRSKA